VPFSEPNQLGVVSASSDRGLKTDFTYPDYADYNARNQVFEGLICYVQRPLTLSAGGQAERLQGMIVSGNYFRALRVQPVLAKIAATRLVTSFLYNVRPTDPITFVGAALLLAGVAFLANYLPARQASHTDPLVALRCDK